MAHPQAKYALPRGGGPAPRTTRIFVARIPLSVSDAQFRQYFEQFGHVQVRCRRPVFAHASAPQATMHAMHLRASWVLPPTCLMTWHV